MEINRGARGRARRSLRLTRDPSDGAGRCAPPSELRESSDSDSNPVPSPPSHASFRGAEPRSKAEWAASEQSRVGECWARRAAVGTPDAWRDVEWFGQPMTALFARVPSRLGFPLSLPPPLHRQLLQQD